MKNLFPLLILLLSAQIGFGQSSQPGTQAAFDQMKKEGKLNGHEATLVNPSPSRLAMPIGNVVNTEAITRCHCYQQRDTTWYVAQFDGSGNSGGPGVAPDYRNDDWSTVAIPLGFNFCFYGSTITEVYINNNGSISIGTAYSTFTPDTFPSVNFVMIAPFWSDVDTRGALSGLVYYQQTSTHLIVQWDGVGYYDSHDDKANHYQLVITDGTDAILPPGNNVSFCYGDMQWTTGDASDGINGFGGFPAVAGINNGDGINYVQLGAYDTSGVNYAGPYDHHSGVDQLDGQSYLFNVCVTGNNVPPIESEGSGCDTVALCVGRTLIYSQSYLSPESGQTTTCTADFHGLSNASILSVNNGNQADINVTITATAADVGFHTVDLIATDNGIPSRTTLSPVVIHVYDSAHASFTAPQLVFANVPVGFTNTSTGAANYIWDFGDGSPTDTSVNPLHAYAVEGTYTITLIVVGQGPCANDTMVATIDIITSIESVLLNNPAVTLVPNPATDEIRFIADKSIQKFHLTIYDLSGKIVLDNAECSISDKLNIAELDRGVYFYRLADENEVSFKVGRLILN